MKHLNTIKFINYSIPANKVNTVQEHVSHLQFRFMIRYMAMMMQTDPEMD